MTAMEISNLLSAQTGELYRNVLLFRGECCELWRSSGRVLGEFGKIYTPNEKAEIESILREGFNTLIKQMNGRTGNNGETEKWIKEILSSLDSSTSGLIDRIDINLDTILSDELLTATDDFINDVRQFNCRLEPGNIYQAIRNVWIMNTLQLYFGRDIAHTQSIFAYSMLYPYTDNINDNIGINGKKKADFNFKLKGWLEGDDPKYSDQYEEQVRWLVKKISADYPREKFPCVHESVLLIYNAQIKSHIQQNPVNGLPEEDILEISFEKGGTSVLADGFLVNGGMDLDEQKFCFSFGTFLQIDDDLQDVETDLKNKHKTLYSSIAGKTPLDNEVNRLVNYMNSVLERDLGNGRTRNEPLRDLIRNSCNLLILDAVRKNNKYFSDAYLAEMEQYSPVGFAFYTGLEKDLKSKITDKYKHRFTLDTFSQCLRTIINEYY